MPLKLFDAELSPGAATAAAIEGADDARKAIVRVVVEVLTALSNCLHHLLLCLLLGLRSLV